MIIIAKLSSGWFVTRDSIKGKSATLVHVSLIVLCMYLVLFYCLLIMSLVSFSSRTFTLKTRDNEYINTECSYSITLSTVLLIITSHVITYIINIKNTNIKYGACKYCPIFYMKIGEESISLANRKLF